MPPTGQLPAVEPITLASLWLPILVSAAAVWVASAVIWMALPFHAKDLKKLPDEEGFLASLRSLNMPPGYYMFPHSDKNSCKDPEFRKRWEAGPTGLLNLWPSGPSDMGKKMVMTLGVYALVGALIAYIASLALPRGAEFTPVFRVTASAGVLAYCFSFLPDGIWFNRPRRALAVSVMDGVVFGLVTGAVFGLLWP